MNKSLNFFQVIYLENDEEPKQIIWREDKPNSDVSNIPLLLWRADENNTASCSLAFGLFNKGFT